MIDRYVFTVDCDDALLKSVVRRFLLRALFFEHTWISVAALFFILVSTAMTFASRDFNLTTGVFAGSSAAAALWIWRVGYRHLRTVRAEAPQMKPPKGTFRLRDGELSVEADSGSMSSKWRAIKDTWRFPRFWLPMLGANPFLTLPIGDVPADALAFVASNVTPPPL
jgi:hypothetical protein